MNSQNTISKIMSMDVTSSPRVCRGRDVGGGIFRGFGLEYGNFMKIMEYDKLFLESAEPIKGQTYVTRIKLASLYLLISHWLPQLGSGDIIEFRSYRRGSAIFMASVIKKLGLPITVYGLDTFKGMPITNKEVDLHKKGDFSDTSVKEVRGLAKKLGLKNIKFVPGLFEKTAKKVLKKCKPILLAHIDCDIESSIKFSYSVVKDFMISTGGYIVFDDAIHGSCLGAFQAIEDCLIREDGLSAEQVYPHLIFRYPKLINETVKTHNLV